MGHNENEQSNAPVPQNGTNLILRNAGADTLPLRRTMSGGLTSADLDTPAGRVTYYKMAMNQALKADEFVNGPIDVVHVLVSPAQSVDADTGELEQWARCVLLLGDGRTVSFGSKGVLKSLALYIDCMGPPPWDPPAEFILRATPIGKNRWYELVAPALLSTTIKSIKRTGPLPKVAAPAQQQE